MTLKDIAKEAGVSVSTVSRVLNNKGHNAASIETQDKIWSIVRKTGYTPNIAAQTLKKGLPDSIGKDKLSFLDFIISGNSALDANPLLLALERSIQQEAFLQKYLVRRISLNEIPSSAEARGAILLDNYKTSAREFRTLKKTYKNLVYTGVNPTDLDCDQVISNGYHASFSAVSYLFSLGHRKIAYIGSAEDECRFYGYKKALQKHDLSFHTGNTVIVKPTASGGFYGAVCLMERLRDISAVFCSNDTIASGAIRGFAENKKYVPKDLSVIGMGDFPSAQSGCPMLTTIRIPIEELGRISVKILLDRIRFGHRLPIKIEVPFSIAKRNSCAFYRR